MAIPRARHWLFWDVDPSHIAPVRDAAFVIPRVLEHGMMADVRWLLRVVGRTRIHAFLRHHGHPELSRRTIAFWRAYFNAEDEPWAEPPQFRRHSALPWPA